MSASKLYLTLLLASISSAAFAGDGDPTPRRGMDPKDNAQLLYVKAQRWNISGADQAVATQTLNHSASGTTKGCVINIGSPPTQDPRAGISSGRYGPQPKSPPVFVAGSIFSTCK
jgi:hypothetical protein